MTHNCRGWVKVVNFPGLIVFIPSPDSSFIDKHKTMARSSPRRRPWNLVLSMRRFAFKVALDENQPGHVRRSHSKRGHFTSLRLLLRHRPQSSVRLRHEKKIILLTTEIEAIHGIGCSTTRIRATRLLECAWAYSHCITGGCGPGLVALGR